ncbi:MAG: DUF4112 domain-containing protein [Candidatus Gracilibacteria bacterium]
MSNKEIITPEIWDHEHERILTQIAHAKSAEERVRLFANIMDKKGVDFLLGLIPAVGDAGVAILASAYLFYEAKKAKLSTADMWKIFKHQAIDLGYGFIPVIGDIADLFSQSNTKSLKYFEANTNKLIEEARKRGVSQAKIDELLRESTQVTDFLRAASQKKAVRVASRAAFGNFFKKN